MRVKLFSIRLVMGYGIAALLIAGCASFSTASPTAFSITATFTPTLLAVTATATASPFPPTATPSRTPPPPTQTPTLAPTLPIQKQEAYIRELLKTNGGCQLPCWWGIMPGQTTWAETEQFLLSLRARIIDGKPDPQGLVFHGTGGFDFEKIGIHHDIDFFESNGIVSAISIGAEGYSNPLAFQEAWAHYSPKEVILTYGPPSRVWVGATSHFIEPTDSKTIGYSLLLFYDNLGFLVEYSAAVKYASPYRMCPAVENESEGMKAIDLFLQSPSNQTPLEDSSGLLAPGAMDYIKPIEEAAGLSTEEFYRLFTQNGQAACFETPQNIWP